MASYAGLYWSERTEASHEIAVQDGSLQLLTTEGPYVLVPIGGRSFQLTAAPRRIVFTFREPARTEGIRRLLVEASSAAPVEYARVDRWRPPKEDLPQYTGRYSSDEGLSPFDVALDARLRILRRKSDPDELVPIVLDVFRTEIGVVRFLRDSSGRVIALEWTTDRTRRMRFVRAQ